MVMPASSPFPAFDCVGRADAGGKVWAKGLEEERVIDNEIKDKGIKIKDKNKR